MKGRRIVNHSLDAIIRLKTFKAEEHKFLFFLQMCSLLNLDFVSCKGHNVLERI